MLCDNSEKQSYKVLTRIGEKKNHFLQQNDPVLGVNYKSILMLKIHITQNQF